MYRIERSNDLTTLLSDATTWNQLAGGVPFRETSWLRPWWQHFGGDLQAYTLVARDENNAIRGILPLYLQEVKSQGRTLAMMGDGQACSDYVSVLAADDQREQVARLMAEHLADVAADSQDGWDLIDIDGVVEDDAAMIAFVKTLSARGATAHSQSRMSTWFKPRDENWDAHLKHFAKTQRRKMRRWSERIDATDGLELAYPINSAEVQEYLDAMIQLHQRRWNQDGQPGSFADQRFRRFIHDCAQDFYQRGQLHLPSLRFDNKPIGGELHFLGGNGRLYCFSSGYDVDSAQWEPGRLLVVEAIKRVYRDDLAGIDYLRGDEAYKQRMAATPTRILRVRVVAPTLIPRLRHAAWWTGFELKQWMRRRTGRTPIAVVDLAAEDVFEPSAVVR